MGFYRFPSYKTITYVVIMYVINVLCSIFVYENTGSKLVFNADLAVDILRDRHGYNDNDS